MHDAGQQEAAEHLSNELAEVSEYRHELELQDADPLFIEHHAVPSLQRDGRVADPMAMLLERVR